MHDTYLQNEPMTSSLAAPVEKKSSHKMLQTNWIILYICENEHVNSFIENANQNIHL